MACQLTYSQSYKVKEKKDKAALFYGSKNITGYVYDEIKREEQGRHLVKNEKGWGLIRSSGESLIPCRYDTLISMLGEGYKVMEGEKYGVVSEVDEVLLEIKYEKVDHYRDGEYLAKVDGVWTMKKGNEMRTDWQKFVFVRPEQPPLYATCSPNQLKEGKTDEDCSQKKMLMKVYGSIKYPAVARESGVQGTCLIRFLIDKNGKAQNFEIVRDIGAGCGQESLRVAKLLQNWTPAQEGGINVATEYNLPIKFKLQ
jgi:protein TonB